MATPYPISPPQNPKPNDEFGPGYRELEYGLMPASLARDELGKFTAWRYQRNVDKFFERIDEQAFYKGLGGMAIRELDHITEEQRDTAVGKAFADRVAAEMYVNEKTSAADAIGRLKEAALAASDVGTLALAMRAEKAVTRNGLTPKVKAALVAGDLAALEDALDEERYAPRDTKTPKLETDISKGEYWYQQLRAERADTHALAGEGYKRPKGMRQRRAHKKVMGLVNRIKPDKEYTERYEGNELFRQLKTRKVEVTGAWISSRRRQLKDQLEHHEINPIHYEEEVHELDHMKKHMKSHPIYRRLEEWEIGGDTVREQPNITPHKDYISADHREESNMVELRRRIENGTKRGDKRSSDEAIQKRTKKLERKYAKLKDRHRTWQIAARTDEGYREAKRENKTHPLTTPNNRTMYDIPNNRLVEKINPSRSKEMADVTGWVSTEHPIRKRKRPVHTGYNWVTGRGFYSRKKIAKHKDIADTSGWM